MAFPEVQALGRIDTENVGAGTNAPHLWALDARGRFLRRVNGSYQVPTELPCDRTFVASPLDAVYLEAMNAFLQGTDVVAPITNERFWRVDLPPPSKAGQRTAYDRCRTEWALCRGFGHVISFAGYDALRADDRLGALFVVCTDSSADSSEKLTRLRLSLEHFPRLPSVVTGAWGPPGLCVSLPRVLRFFGSEVELPSRFRPHANRLAWAVKVEFVNALVAALHLDFVSTKTVLVVDAPCLELLEEFEALPPLAVSVPGVGGTPTTIAELVARLRAARAMGDEFLIERKDYPSQTAVRLAVYDEGKFVVAATYLGGFHGGRPLVGARRHARPLASRPAEPRGPKEPNPPKEARSRRERRAQGYFSGFGGGSIDRHAHAKQAGLDSCLMDAEVRSCPEVSSLHLGREARAGGWTVR